MSLFGISTFRSNEVQKQQFLRRAIFDNTQLVFQIGSFLTVRELCATVFRLTKQNFNLSRDNKYSYAFFRRLMTDIDPVFMHAQKETLLAMSPSQVSAFCLCWMVVGIRLWLYVDDWFSLS